MNSGSLSAKTGNAPGKQRWAWSDGISQWRPQELWMRTGRELSNGCGRSIFNVRRQELIKRGYKILHGFAGYNRLLELKINANDVLQNNSSSRRRWNSYSSSDMVNSRRIVWRLLWRKDTLKSNRDRLRPGCSQKSRKRSKAKIHIHFLLARWINWKEGQCLGRKERPSNCLFLRVPGIIHGPQWLFPASDVLLKAWRALSTHRRGLSGAVRPWHLPVVTELLLGYSSIIMKADRSTLYVCADTHQYRLFPSKSRRMRVKALRMGKISIPSNSFFRSCIHANHWVCMRGDIWSEVKYQFHPNAKLSESAIVLAYGPALIYRPAWVPTSQPLSQYTPLHLVGKAWTLLNTFKIMMYRNAQW